MDTEVTRALEAARTTLLQVIQEQGGKTTDEAAVYLEGLKEEGRYLKDVY